MLLKLPVEILIVIFAYSEKNINNLISLNKLTNSIIKNFKNKISNIIIHDYKIFSSEESKKHMIDFDTYLALKEHYSPLFDKCEFDFAFSLKNPSDQSDPDIYRNLVSQSIANNKFLIYLLLESAFPKLNIDIDKILPSLIHDSIEFNQIEFLVHFTKYKSNVLSTPFQDYEFILLAVEFASLEIFSYLIENENYQIDLYFNSDLVIITITRFNRYDILDYIINRTTFPINYSNALSYLCDYAFDYDNILTMNYLLDKIISQNIIIDIRIEILIEAVLNIINKPKKNYDLEIQLSTIIIAKMKTNKLLFECFDKIIKILINTYNYDLSSDDNVLLRNALMADNALEFVDYLLKDNAVKLKGARQAEFKKIFQLIEILHENRLLY